jgi:hypothetical protein
MSKITSKSTTKEIIEVYGKILETGLAVAVSVEDTKNPAYKNVQIAQYIQSEDNNEVNSIILGWNRNLVRAWKVMPVDIAINKGKLTEGMVLNELFTNVAGRSISDVNILVKETFEPITYQVKGEEGVRTRPFKVYPVGHPQAGQAVLVDGKNVYREVEIIIGKANHQFKRAVTTSVEQQQANPSVAYSRS